MNTREKIEELLKNRIDVCNFDYFTNGEDNPENFKSGYDCFVELIDKLEKLISNESKNKTR